MKAIINIDDETYRLWNINVAYDRFISIPGSYVEPYADPLSASIYLALRSLEGFGGEIMTTPELLAKRIGIKASNRRAVLKIINFLNMLIDKEVLLNCHVEKITARGLITGTLVSSSKAIEIINNSVKFDYVKLYGHDLLGYRRILKKYPKLKFYQYVNQLLTIKRTLYASKYCRDKREFSYSVASEKTMENRTIVSSHDIKAWLKMFSEAKVLAWATFNRTTTKGTVTSKNIAVINYCEGKNMLRLDRAIRLSNPRSYHKTYVTKYYF